MFYVYQFINSSDEIIYVGRTNNINTRIRKQHFTNNGHLDQSCYQETIMILYSECTSLDDSKIKERYLINKISPKYNQCMNNNSKFNFEIKDFNWIYMPVIDDIKIENDLLAESSQEHERIKKTLKTRKVTPIIKPINKFSKNNLIINDASYKLSINRMKIFNLILYKSYKMNSKNVIVTVDELRDIGGETPYTLKKIKSQLNRIKETDFLVNDDKMNFIQRYKFNQNTYEFEILINEKFLNNSEDCTTLDIQAILKLKYLYSIRLYEILKSFKINNIKNFKMDLDNFKKLMCLSNDSYNNFSNINLKVLKPSLKDINENTEVRYDYKEFKCGRRVNGIIFTIK